MTLAHVLPQAVGGRLAARFLCHRCNSRLGHSVERGLKRDPSIRLAVEALAADIPELARDMREGEPLYAKEGDVSVRAISRGGSYRVGDAMQPDGSLVKSPGRARQDIMTTLRRAGATAEEIQGAVDTHDRAGAGELVRLAPGLTIRKGTASRFYPSLGTPPVDPRCPLSSAYLFLALLLGTTIYDPALQPIRDALNRDVDSGSFHVESLRARRDYEPWHGLAVDADQPYLRAQIRLFGQVAWRVHFNVVSAPLRPTAYRHDLVTGEEQWSVSDVSSG